MASLQKLLDEVSPARFLVLDFLIMSSADESKKLDIQRDTVKSKISDNRADLSIVDEFVISKQVDIHGVSCLTTCKGLNLYKNLGKFFINSNFLSFFSLILILVFILSTNVGQVSEIFSSLGSRRTGAAAGSADNSTTQLWSATRRTRKSRLLRKLSGLKSKEKSWPPCSNKMKTMTIKNYVNFFNLTITSNDLYNKCARILKDVYLISQASQKLRKCLNYVLFSGNSSVVHTFVTHAAINNSAAYIHQ